MGLNRSREGNAYVSGLWIILAVVVVVLRVYLLSKGVLRRSYPFDYTVLLMALVAFLCCVLWARSLGTRSGMIDNRLMWFSGGAGFLLSVVAGYLSIGLLVEPISTLMALGDETHGQFIVAFVIVSGIVSGGTGFMLGLGLKDLRLALTLLWQGFLVGAIVFFITDLLMVAVGFQVGVPRPDGLPSMPVVTALGFSLTALVGSAVFGRALERWNRPDQRGLEERLDAVLE